MPVVRGALILSHMIPAVILPLPYWSTTAYAKVDGLMDGTPIFDGLLWGICTLRRGGARRQNGDEPTAMNGGPTMRLR